MSRAEFGRPRVAGTSPHQGHERGITRPGKSICQSGSSGHQLSTDSLSHTRSTLRLPRRRMKPALLPAALCVMLRPEVDHAQQHDDYRSLKAPECRPRCVEGGCFDEPAWNSARARARSGVHCLRGERRGTRAIPCSDRSRDCRCRRRSRGRPRDVDGAAAGEIRQLMPTKLSPGTN